MNNLEDLVPPLELCRKIPAGKFEESALVWFYDGISWWVNAREFDATSEEEYPAPTLAEIMETLCDYEPVSVTEWRTGQTVITCQVFGDEMEQSDYNPANAALNLWLELNAKETAK